MTCQSTCYDHYAISAYPVIFPQTSAHFQESHRRHRHPASVESKGLPLKYRCLAELAPQIPAQRNLVWHHHTGTCDSSSNMRKTTAVDLLHGRSITYASSPHHTCISRPTNWLIALTCSNRLKEQLVPVSCCCRRPAQAGPDSVFLPTVPTILKRAYERSWLQLACGPARGQLGPLAQNT